VPGGPLAVFADVADTKIGKLRRLRCVVDHDGDVCLAEVQHAVFAALPASADLRQAFGGSGSPLSGCLRQAEVSVVAVHAFLRVSGLLTTVTVRRRLGSRAGFVDHHGARQCAPPSPAPSTAFQQTAFGGRQ
jgi:hypothetical protein